MHIIGIHKITSQLISSLYFCGIWQKESHSRFRVWCSRLWYLISYGCIVIAIAVGAMTTNNDDEVVFLVVMTIVAGVIEIRLYLFLWKKDDIIGFIRKMGSHSIKDDERFVQVNDRLNNLMKFVAFFEVTLFLAVSSMALSALPFITSERRLPMGYYFPFDWHDNTFNYIIAYSFVFYGLMLTSYLTITNAVIWFVMMSCGIKYLILGDEFRNIGWDFAKMPHAATDEDLRLLDLIGLLKKHKELQETTYQFQSFSSNLFFIQIFTSGLAMCGCVYAMAFGSIMANPFQYAIYGASMFYSIFDIFMITYFGNEIKFASSKLLNSVFESNWVDQSKRYKSSMVVIQEVMKRPQVLVIGKMYTMDLEMFSSILNFAYSQFNILKNVKF